MKTPQEQVKKAFCYQKLFWPFTTKFLRSLEQFIQTVKGQNNVWQQNAFLTCSLKFLRSNKLEKLEFKLEKIIGI